MGAERVQDYLAEIDGLAAQYAGRMEILKGFEIDWLKGEAGPRAPFWSNIKKDYALGAVHFITAPDGARFTVDEGAESFFPMMEEHYNGDGKRLVLDYWQAMTELIQAGGFDIIAHIDLIKKNNADNRFFDESAAWYRDAAMTSLEAAAKSGIVMEVNTGGIARKKINETYPGPWLLKEARRLGVPMTLDSDAHHPDHLAACVELGRQALLDAGYREVRYLSNGQWRGEKI
jgi:histidinol-phosphatase (PHP family)